MAWRFNNPFRKGRAYHKVVASGDVMSGQYGFGGPLKIVFRQRQLPGSTDNAALAAYLTQLQPKWTPIGGGVPNKRDIGTGKPMYAVQGALLQQVGSPGLLAGSFVSGPLLNVDSSQSPATAPVPGSFMLPQN